MKAGAGQKLVVRTGDHLNRQDRQEDVAAAAGERYPSRLGVSYARMVSRIEAAQLQMMLSAALRCAAE